MVALLLVAVSLGLSNLAAAVGIGVTGIDARTRLRVGLIFGFFETAMPIIGLLLGHSLAAALGHAAHWVGAGLLVATGFYALTQAVRAPGREQGDEQPEPGQRTGRLLVTGLALSIDNLAVGFALGAYRVNVAVAAIVIGVVNSGMPSSRSRRRISSLSVGAAMCSRSAARPKCSSLATATNASS